MCAPSVVGGAEVTSRPHLINVDDMFQKDTKALSGGQHEHRQTDGQGSTKVAGRSSNVLKPVFIQEVPEDNGRYSDT